MTDHLREKINEIAHAITDALDERSHLAIEFAWGSEEGMAASLTLEARDIIEQKLRKLVPPLVAHEAEKMRDRCAPVARDIECEQDAHGRCDASLEIEAAIRALPLDSRKSRGE